MKAIGIMSGTSLDGIDICVVNINQKNNDYEYNILFVIKYNKTLIISK